MNQTKIDLIPNPIRPIKEKSQHKHRMHTKTLFYIYAIGSLFFCITFTINFSKLLKTSQQNPSTPTKMAAPKPDETKINETFYISHGSPTLSIDDSLPARHFLKSFRQKVFPQTPKSILIISGHWETSDPVVNSISGPLDTIYDFYGFPNKMYKLKYPAPGSPDLSARVIELLKKSGFKSARVDRTRGLDHGAWVPLMLMFPDADIPVCQLSVQTNRDARHHYEVGRALRELKDEGVLILGSGAATHNLGMIDRSGGGGVAKWAYEFDTWIKERLEEGKYEEVNDYEDKAPYARVAHPSPDHFYPLHVAMGAAGEGTRGELVHGSWSYGTLSYASYRFGAKSDEGRV